MGEGGRTILSIDGGGIRGLIPALVLDYVERRCGRPIGELFDVIAGTSTGGMIALGLSCPDDDGPGRKFTAADLVALYEEDGERIFPPSIFSSIRRLTNEKYSANGLESVLRERLGDARLSDALTDVIVTAYDIHRRESVFFRSAKARETPATHDFEMWKVARATSAGPTYFEPMRIPAGPSEPDYALVDGGVFANNPGMCAFVDAHAGRADTDDMLMVSLGTGYLTRPLPFDQAKDWGLAGWAPNLLNVAFDGQSDTVHYQLAQILGSRYHRFQIALERARDDLDDARPSNVRNLRLEAEKLIARDGAQLEGLCELLTRRADG